MMGRGILVPEGFLCDTMSLFYGFFACSLSLMDETMGMISSGVSFFGLR
jgi:hypothetical protein